MKKFFLSVVISLLCAYSFAQTTGTFKDTRDGKSYKTIKIGEQWWFAENLNYASKNSSYYDDNLENAKKFGRFYSAEEASSVCPVGWRTPNHDEVIAFFSSIGSNNKTIINKISSTTEWGKDKYDNSMNGLNENGFNLYPAGYQTLDNKYTYNGGAAGFWETGGNVWLLSPMVGIVTEKPAAFEVQKISVRCIKN